MLGMTLFRELNGNQLKGPIPNTIGQLKSVTWVDLSSNQLTGSLPVSSSPGSNGLGLDNMTVVKHL
jgi:Leucine-rich repeat (LRR) protein